MFCFLLVFCPFEKVLDGLDLSDPPASADPASVIFLPLLCQVLTLKMQTTTPNYTVFLCVTLAVLELAVQTRLASNSRDTSASASQMLSRVKFVHCCHHQLAP